MVFVKGLPFVSVLERSSRIFPVINQCWTHAFPYAEYFTSEIVVVPQNVAPSDRRKCSLVKSKMDSPSTESYNVTTTWVNSDMVDTDAVLVQSEQSTGLSVGTICWAVVNGVIFVAILGGSTLTIIAVRTCRRLRSIVSNSFILSLAISDLIVGLSLPFNLLFYLSTEVGKSRGLCLLRFFLIIFACCVSILTLIAIAVDRYIAIVYALHYRRFMTRRVAAIIITCSWICGVSIASIPMFWNHWNSARQCEFDEVLPPWYMAGVITPGFILIWVFMLLVYWRIMREAAKHARQLRSSTSTRGPNNTLSDWKSVQVVLFIMGCFSICWLPYFIVACAQIFDVYNTTSVLYKGAFSLAMTNSGLNPVIYSWKNSNFRRAFGQLLRCRSPNNGPHNLDASQYSVRSHYMPRQQSSNSMIVVAITPLNDDQQQIVERANNKENPTNAPAPNNTDDLLHTKPAEHLVALPDEEDVASISGTGVSCATCVLCKNLLRKSTHIKQNIIQKAIDDELAKYTPTMDDGRTYTSNNNNDDASGKDFDHPHSACDQKHISLSLSRSSCENEDSSIRKK